MLTILAFASASYATPPEFDDAWDDRADDVEWVDLRPVNLQPTGIWGGERTQDYPNVVALANLSQGHIFCSGTLIQGKWVVTAAHCLSDQDWSLSRGDLYILFGNDIINQGYSDAIQWADFHQHPNYDGNNFEHDIGLIELDTQKMGVDYSVLNDESISVDWYDEYLTFVGFGITNDNAYDSGTKRETDIPIDTYDSQYVYSEHGTSNVCQGDSGGAAFETTNQGNLELVGINAFVYPGCAGGGNGATRVDAHLDFILGYVPDVLLGGSGEGSGGDENGNNNGSNGDNPFDGSVDLDGYDRDFGEAMTPEDAKYPRGLRCSTGPVPGSVGWLVLLGALGVFTRRR